MELQAADADPPNLAGQSVVGAFAQLRPVLADGGKGGLGGLADGQIVNADDAHILRNVDTVALAAGHHLPGQQVVAADQGGAALGQKPGQVGVQTFGNGEGVAGQQAIFLQSVLAQGPEESQVPLLIDVGAQAAADVSDFPVAQLFQLFNGGFHGLVVVNAHLGDHAVVLGMVVQQHSGGAAGAELPHPVIGEGGAQEEGTLVVVSQHIFVVMVLLLQLAA